jgi:hypothetical protein
VSCGQPQDVTPSSGRAKLTLGVQAIKYHAFFIEGASHVLALDLLQGRAAGRANLPWVQLAIRTLRLLRHKTETNPACIHMPMVHLAENLERMARSVYPDFRVTPDETPGPNSTTVGTHGANFAVNPDLQPPYPDPASMLFGLDVSSTATSPSAPLQPEAVDQLADLTPADGEWNFDFATADMEAFLSIDPNWTTYG